MTHRMVRDTESLLDRGGPDGVGNGDDRCFAHTKQNAKLFSEGQANTETLCQISLQGMFAAMSKDPIKPYADIAERLRWHRELLGLSQGDYAEKIGKKRSAYSLWEAGSHRLSLDGALALRQTFGLSLDFMYAGIDDALPMTLRNAWIDRSRVRASK